MNLRLPGAYGIIKVKQPTVACWLLAGGYSTAGHRFSQEAWDGLGPSWALPRLGAVETAASGLARPVKVTAAQLILWLHPGGSGSWLTKRGLLQRLPRP